MSDLISRQAVLGEISDMFKDVKKWGNEAKDDEIKTKSVACMSALIEIKLRLKALPSVEPERKTGMWIHDEDWECDQCGKHFINVDEDEYGVPHFDFCPNCGCEMGVV